MDWKVTHTRTEDDWFNDYVAAVLTSRPPALPARVQRVGSADVTWFETTPGTVFVNVEGGNTFDDRRFAHLFVKNQLKAHGFKIAEYDIDTPFYERRAGWSDIMEKAQRLRGEGKVQLLRNGADVVVGQVEGDHGTYQTEISREDPSSRSITQWQCDCPWDQYAWQRTRQWKKYEGRPCAHVLATFWESQATPIDEDVHPAQQMQQGQPGMPGSPNQMNLFNMSPTPPTGMPMGQPMMTPNRMMAPPGSAPQMPIPGVDPMMAQGVPVSDPGLIPPFPGAPLPEPVDPHTLPVSQPGGYLPNPHNPVQYPGGTWSSVKTDWKMSADFKPQPAGLENSHMVQLLVPEMGIAEGKSEAHGAGQYREMPAGSIGEVMGQDASTGWVEVIFPLHDSGPMEPYHVRMFLDPSQVKERPDVQRPGPFVKRRK